MAVIFVCYRRSDAESWATRLRAVLEATLGQGVAFQDRGSIPAGVDFRRSVREALDKCVAVLVVVGPTWLVAADASGRRRIDDAEDHVRTEIEAALEKGVPVIPVVVGGASLPKPSDLPPSIGALVYRNATFVSQESDLEGAVAPLCEDLLGYLTSTSVGSVRVRPLSMPKGGWLHSTGEDWEVGVRYGGQSIGAFVFCAIWQLVLYGAYESASSREEALVALAFMAFGLFFAFGIAVERYAWTRIKVSRGEASIFDWSHVFPARPAFTWNQIRRVDVKPTGVVLSIRVDDTLAVDRSIEMARLASPDQRQFLAEVLRGRLLGGRGVDAQRASRGMMP